MTDNSGGGEYMLPLPSVYRTVREYLERDEDMNTYAELKPYNEAQILKAYIRTLDRVNIEHKGILDVFLQEIGIEVQPGSYALKTREGNLNA